MKVGFCPSPSVRLTHIIINITRIRYLVTEWQRLSLGDSKTLVLFKEYYEVYYYVNNNKNGKYLFSNQNKVLIVLFK